MATVKERLKEFYALDGTVYGEALRTLEAFGKTLNDDKSAFFDAVTPHSWRDELFYIKLLQMHKMHAILMSIVLEDHTISTKVILNDPNFIKYLYKDYVAIIKKLPDLSYTLRTKLINKLSFVIDDEQKGFEIYTEVLNEFGLRIATPLLISCKEELIVEAITQQEVKFTERQLIHCYKKFPRLLEVYFKENPCFDQYRKLGQYLCMHDLQTFQSLLKYGAPKIGKKAFARYLKQYKSEFIFDCDKLKNLFKRDPLRRYLDESEFVVFVRKLLPKSVDDFEITWELNKQLLMVPKSIRGRVIFGAFKQLYGFEIWRYDRYWTVELLKLIPSEDRKKFDLSDHVEFGSAEVAIPALEQQLRFMTEQNGRAELFRKVLECCKVNDDMDVLLKVLQNFSKNHANEHQKIRFNVIDHINDYFCLDKFTEEHWTCIDRMIMKFHVNGENVYCVGDTLEKFMTYKVKNKMDFSVQYKLYCKLRGAYVVPKLSENPEIQKCVILKHRSLLDEAFEERFRITSQLTYLSAVIDFNYKYPKFVIPLRYYKEYIGVALETIGSNKYPEFFDEKELLRSVTKHQEEVDEILQEILIACSARNGPYIITWFLRNKRHMLENNIEALFSGNKIDNRCYYELSKMPNSSLHTKMVEYALDVLKNPKEDIKKICSSIKLLSYHRNVNLDELTGIWWPKPDCKIDAHEGGMKDLLEIQKTIIASFRNTFVVENVDNILHFCNGDYTQHVLDSLYSVLFRAPQKLVNETIWKLFGKSVSVRKHALHLATYLCTLEHKRKLLRYSLEHEKNASVQKCILRKLFKCLLSDRTEHDWAQFSSHLRLMDPNDKELIPELLSSERIPKKFYTEFIELIWTHISSRGKSEEYQVLLRIDYNKFTFSEFCDEIIQRSLFNPANKHPSETRVFIYNYLTHSKPNETIWNRIREASNENEILESLKFQKDLHGLFKSICAQVLKAKTNFDIVETALGKLQHLQVSQSILPLLEVALSCKLTNLPDPKIGVDRLDLLVEQHGIVVVNYYGELLREFIQLFEGNEDEIGLDLALGVSKRSDGIAAKLLCLHLMPQSMPKNESIRAKFLDLVGLVRDGASDVVTFELSAVVQNLEY